MSGFFLVYGTQFISLWAWCSIFDKATFGISHLNKLLPTEIRIRKKCECFMCVCVRFYIYIIISFSYIYKA